MYKKFEDPNRTGDLAELKASAWLMEQGYRVYRNLGCTGRTDLVIESEDGELTKIQVKSLCPIDNGVTRKNGDPFSNSFAAAREYYKEGIKMVWVWEDQVGWNRDDFSLPSFSDIWPVEGKSIGSP